MASRWRDEPVPFHVRCSMVLIPDTVLSWLILAGAVATMLGWVWQGWRAAAARDSIPKTGCKNCAALRHTIRVLEENNQQTLQRIEALCSGDLMRQQALWREAERIATNGTMTMPEALRFVIRDEKDRERGRQLAEGLGWQSWEGLQLARMERLMNERLAALNGHSRYSRPIALNIAELAESPLETPYWRGQSALYADEARPSTAAAARPATMSPAAGEAASTVNVGVHEETAAERAAREELEAYLNRLSPRCDDASAPVVQVTPSR